MNHVSGVWKRVLFVDAVTHASTTHPQCTRSPDVHLVTLSTTRRTARKYVQVKWNKRVAELVRQYVEPHNLRRVHHTRGQQ